jgi:hypothetical protein
LTPVTLIEQELATNYVPHTHVNKVATKFKTHAKRARLMPRLTHISRMKKAAATNFVQLTREKEEHMQFNALV